MVSHVWKFATKIECEETLKAKCKLCNSSYSVPSGCTGSMLKASGKDHGNSIHFY